MHSHSRAYSLTHTHPKKTRLPLVVVVPERPSGIILEPIPVWRERTRLLYKSARASSPYTHRFGSTGGSGSNTNNSSTRAISFSLTTTVHSHGHSEKPLVKASSLLTSSNTYR